MAATLKIHKPFKWWYVTQKWGVRNTAYDQFGFKLHNGLDVISGYNDANTAYNPKKWPVYNGLEGFTVHQVRLNPNGGGNDIWFISDELLQIGERVCHAYFGFAHADTIFAKAGDKLEIGDMFMIADNTGFSTGPHVHISFYRVDWDGKIMTFLDKNDAHNSFDPEPFLTSEYAVDKASLATLIKNNLRYYQWLLTGK